MNFWKTVWPNTSIFWINMETAACHPTFLSSTAFPFLSFHFWERHLDCKDFSSCNQNKRWGYSASAEKRRIVLSASQRTCHLFLRFTLLLGHSLMCSGTSALTLQLTVTQFLHDTEQRRGSSVSSSCSEENEPWLSANCVQRRAEVISSSCFPAFTCDKGF